MSGGDVKEEEKEEAKEEDEKLTIRNRHSVLAMSARAAAL